MKVLDNIGKCVAQAVSHYWLTRNVITSYSIHYTKLYEYGPFRWVCLSGKPEDLDKTDGAAMSCIDPDRRSYDRDNYVWIRDAKQNRLVVGSQARILYQDAAGRVFV